MKVWLLLGADDSILQRPFYWPENAEDEWRDSYDGSRGGCKVISATLSWTPPSGTP